MMIVKGIDRIKRSDMTVIDGWYALRGLPIPAYENMSDLGFICDGRVAGWLYLTNSNLAMIEGIIADPRTVPGFRKESLQKLIGYLIDQAHYLGYEQIIGISQSKSIFNIGKKFGFKIVDSFKLMHLDIDRLD
jgi:hypothetical protein